LFLCRPVLIMKVLNNYIFLLGSFTSNKRVTKFLLVLVKLTNVGTREEIILKFRCLGIILLEVIMG